VGNKTLNTFQNPARHLHSPNEYLPTDAIPCRCGECSGAEAQQPQAGAGSTNGAKMSTGMKHDSDNLFEKCVGCTFVFDV
jgi:hypothetical protein